MDEFSEQLTQPMSELSRGPHRNEQSEFYGVFDRGPHRNERSEFYGVFDRGPHRKERSEFYGVNNRGSPQNYAVILWSITGGFLDYARNDT